MPIKTPTARGARAFLEDCADVRAAHALDAKAEALLPPVTFPRIGGRSSTRGPRQEAIRALARVDPDLSSVRALLDEADAHYWAMVDRHTDLIEQQAQLRTLGDKTLHDVMQTMRMGWFRAALRFDPDRGCRFPTMAGRWGLAAVQQWENEGGTEGGFHFTNRAREAAFGGGTWRIPVTSLDAPLPSGTGSALDGLVAEDADPLAEMVHRSDLGALARGLAMLPARERRVVRLSFGYEDDREWTLAEIGKEIGVTRERVRQILLVAVARLRAAMSASAHSVDPVATP